MKNISIKVDYLRFPIHLLQRRPELHSAIRVGLDQLDRGECHSAEEVFADMRARIAEVEGVQQ